MIRLKITVKGESEILQRVREGLADRSQLHARLAQGGEGLTKAYVAGLNEHGTANRLGARPTEHLAKAAQGIESSSDADGAVLSFPRASRLRAAFGAYTFGPKNGKKYLTIPDHRETYGKRVGEIAAPLHFQIVGGRFKALCFKDGTVAYWLREQVTIEKDRGLLPFDQLKKLARQVTLGYVEELKAGGAA